MKISALIAEFNPLHQGHRFLIEKMREKSDAVVCIMSGNFVQRGECAIFEKTERATSAIYNGVNLVLELPTVYALSSAEGFAKGGVSILNASGVIDELWFGSECGDISALLQTARILNENSPEFQEKLSQKLREGFSYPYARQFASGSDVLSSPNNILGIEYLRALLNLNSNITPVTIKRMGADYNDSDIDKETPSATAIRKAIERKSTPDMLYDFKSKPLFMKDFDFICASRLKTISIDELLCIPDCNEELAVRFKEASKFNTIKEIIESVSCKSYTTSRIKRILCNMMISNTFKKAPDPSYIRPLAFNKKGAEILSMIKEKSTLPVIDRGALLKDDPIFNLEYKSTDIYNLARNISGGGEITRQPFVLS